MRFQNWYILIVLYIALKTRTVLFNVIHLKYHTVHLYCCDA